MVDFTLLAPLVAPLLGGLFQKDANDTNVAATSSANAANIAAVKQSNAVNVRAAYHTQLRNRDYQLKDMFAQRRWAKADYSVARKDTLADYRKERTHAKADYATVRGDNLADYRRTRSDNLEDYATVRGDNLADYDRTRSDALDDYAMTRRDDRRDQMRAPERLVKSAQRAGINPLTLLGAGGAQGYGSTGRAPASSSVAAASIASSGIGGTSIAPTSTRGGSIAPSNVATAQGVAPVVSPSISQAAHVSPLASTDVIANAVSGVSDVLTGDAAQRRAMNEAALELDRLRAEQLRAGGAASVVGPTLNVAATAAGSQFAPRPIQLPRNAARVSTGEPRPLSRPADRPRPMPRPDEPDRLPQDRIAPDATREVDILPRDNFLYTRDVEGPLRTFPTVNTDVVESEAGETINDAITITNITKQQLEKDGHPWLSRAIRMPSPAEYVVRKWYNGELFNLGIPGSPRTRLTNTPIGN